MKATDTTYTPAWVLDVARAVFPIGLDPCAAAGSLVRAKREIRLYLGGDGLAERWTVGRGEGAWVNPPYSHGQIPKWVAKARAERELGTPSQLLLPADTSTEWFADLLVRCSAIAFPKRRIGFWEMGGEGLRPHSYIDKQGKRRAAPPKFASCVVLLAPPDQSIRLSRRFVRAWREHGRVIWLLRGPGGEACVY